MKFQSFLVVTGLSSWGWMAAAAPESISDSGVKEQRKPVAEWVRDLSNDQFRVREDATRKIWEIGEAALADLQAALGDGDAVIAPG